MTDIRQAQAPRGNGPLPQDLLKDFEKKLMKRPAPSVDEGTRPTEPRESSIAKMAGAGISGIAEAMISDIRRRQDEVREMAKSVELEGDQLIASIIAASNAVEEKIKAFADLQAGVRLAFTQSNNQIATFHGQP